ncbi:hypothetical protein M5G07_05820 [Serratia symbiotica]|nr:hypothetical protein [Serratia symbiotica]
MFLSGSGFAEYWLKIAAEDRSVLRREYYLRHAHRLGIIYFYQGDYEYEKMIMMFTLLVSVLLSQAVCAAAYDSKPIE